MGILNGNTAWELQAAVLVNPAVAPIAKRQQVFQLDETPPWDQEWGADVPDEFLERFIFDLLAVMADQSDGIAALSDDDILLVRAAMRRAANYGWVTAVNNDPMAPKRAAQRRGKSIRESAAKRAAGIAAAYEHAARSGESDPVQAVVSQLEVSKATVYRALRRKQPSRKAL